MMIEFRPQSKIRLSPFKNPVRIQAILERDAWDRIKRVAVEEGTTATEIIRVLVDHFLAERDTTAKTKTTLPHM